MSSATEILFKDFSRIGFYVGRISSVEDAKGLRVTAYKVVTQFGGQLKSTVAQLPYNYPDKLSLHEKDLITITNMGSRRMGKYTSEFLAVGFPDEAGHVQLLNTRGMRIAPGSALYAIEPAEQIAYDDFQKADIRVGTITKLHRAHTERGINPLSNDGDSTAFDAEVDLGALLGIRQVLLTQTTEKIANSWIGTQLAVLTNLKQEGSANPTCFALSILAEDGKVYPLGVDKTVPNGGKLF